MDVLDALRGRRRHHHEFQIGAFRSPVDDFEPRLQRPFEMLPNIVDDIVLGGGSQAQDRHGILSVVLGDVTRDVAIVRAKIVPPFRQAVCFVHDPRADAAPGDCFRERNDCEAAPGATSTIPASPKRMWASASARSGMEMRPLIVGRAGDAPGDASP